MSVHTAAIESVEESLFSLSSTEVRRLVARYGTPCFVDRAGFAGRRYRRLRQALPSRVRVAYAVKANPRPELLAELERDNASFDIASAGELARLIALGVRGRRIFFAGPGKRPEEIEEALRRGVRLQAEGIEDLERAEQIAARLGLASVAVNLRVQPLGVEESGAILGGSGPSAFGIDEEDLPELIPRLGELDRVRITGVHGFAATNELDAARLLRTYDAMFVLARRLSRGGLRIEQVDLGGGLGVPYSIGERPLDLALLGAGLEALLARHAWFRGEVVVEPGRYLAAPGGSYVAQVLRTKNSRGELFAVLDGGINHLLRPLLTGCPFPVRLVERSSEPADGGDMFPTVLAGPLCTGLDRLGRVELPPLRAGDLLLFGMTGAYGAREAMPRFLDQRRAPEIWLPDQGLVPPG